MSFAFGHLVGAWLVGKAYEYLTKKKISHYAWFFLLLGGLLPDGDFLLDWTLGTDLHRTFTHSILFLLIVPLTVYLIFRLLKNLESKYFAIFVGVGIATHLFLDGFFSLGVPLLWPKMMYFSFFYGISSAAPGSHLLTGTAEELRFKLKLAILDMGIGTAWTFYLWFRKRIQF